MIKTYLEITPAY